MAYTNDAQTVRLQRLQDGLHHLKAARSCFRYRPRTLARIRKAISSAEGAIRHARLEPHRVARQKEANRGKR